MLYVICYGLSNYLPVTLISGHGVLYPDGQYTVFRWSFFCRKAIITTNQCQSQNQVINSVQWISDIQISRGCSRGGGRPSEDCFCLPRSALKKGEKWLGENIKPWIENQATPLLYGQFRAGFVSSTFLHLYYKNSHILSFRFLLILAFGLHFTSLKHMTSNASL